VEYVEGEKFIKTKKYTFDLSTEMEQKIKLTDILPITALKPSGRRVTDFRPETFARQLIYFEFQLYERIRFHEVNYWLYGGKNAREKRAPNLSTFIDFSNKLSQWVATEIVSNVNQKSSQHTVKRLIAVASYCLKYNNFDAVVAITSGLSNASITRLAATWRGISKKHLDTLQSLRNIVSPESNYQELRPLMEISPPYVPYIGVFLKDLTFIKDGMPSKIENKINWKKMSKISGVLQQFKRPTRAEINTIQPNPDIQRFFAEELFYLDEKTLYEKSLTIEPRRGRRNSLV